MKDKKENPKHIDRREFICNCARYACLAGLVGTGIYLSTKEKKTDSKDSKHKVWQLDPKKCTQCGNCATKCVLTPSAVKCVHVFAVCGYCNLCGGYFQQNSKELTTGGENQLCPTAAIKRTYIDDPYYEYTIDEPLCIGCAKCVKGCGAFGNGSLVLQVRHDLCINCNECNIAKECPSQAFSLVPSNKPSKI